MTLRDTVAKWHAAICLISENRLAEASQKLLEIQKPSAKILYNLGCVCMLQRRYEDAIQYFSSSISHDKYLAVACYQRGVCYLEVQRYEKAKLDFLSALSMIRSESIDYKLLGAEVILTKQLLDVAIANAENCCNLKKTEKFQALPVRDCIFHPPKACVNNLVKQDFLGSAKLITSTTENDIVLASENRALSQPCSQVKNHTSSSVPSSPTSSRHQINISNENRILIPYPKRPPPRLPYGTTVDEKMHFKSRSLEELISYDYASSGIEGDHKSAAVKPTSVNNHPLITNNSRVGFSKFSNFSNQPCVKKSHKGLKTYLTNDSSNQDRGQWPSFGSSFSQNILGGQNENSTDATSQMQKISEKPVSSKFISIMENKRTNLGHCEGRTQGQSSLIDLTGRIKFFEGGKNLEQQLELKVGADRRGNNSLSNKLDIAHGDNLDIAQKKISDIAERKMFDAAHRNKPEIAQRKIFDAAHRSKPEIAQRKIFDVTHRSKPNIACDNKSIITHDRRTELKQHKPDTGHNSESKIAHNKPDVPNKNK